MLLEYSIRVFAPGCALNILVQTTPPPRQRRLSAGFCIFRLIFTACHRIGRHKVYFLYFHLSQHYSSTLGEWKHFADRMRGARARMSVCVCVCRCESISHQLMVQHLHHLRAIFPKHQLQWLTVAPRADYPPGRGASPSSVSTPAACGGQKEALKILRGSTSRVSKV